MLFTLSAEDTPADTTEFEVVDIEATLNLDEMSSYIIYPVEARRTGMEGEVYLQCLIDEQANVEKLVVEYADHDYLIENAINAVKQVRTWESGEKDGKTVKMWISIPVEYKLQSSSFFAELVAWIFGGADEARIKLLNDNAMYHVGDVVEVARNSRLGINNKLPVRYLNLDKKPKVLAKLLAELLVGNTFPQEKLIDKDTKIKVKVLIDQIGNPMDVKILESNNKELEESVIDLIKNFQFEPFRRNDRNYFADLVFTITVDPKS
jgi:TonB family protein